jgi:hypothetical protein
MHVKDIQAVPVVDEQGVIVTTLSTADTKGLDASNITKCLLPVIGSHPAISACVIASVEPLPLINRSCWCIGTDYLKEMNGGKLIHPITCSPKDTLGEVVLKMKVATIHRHQVHHTKSEPTARTGTGLGGDETN